MTSHRAISPRRPRGAPADVVPILLPGGRVTWVDPDTAARFGGYPMRCRDHRGYVALTVNGRREYLHRLIMDAPHGRLVHHRDGNVLHNWRANLVLCDDAQNAQWRAKRAGRRSEFLGIWRETGRKRWRAAIMVLGKRHVLGSFATELEAAHEWDRVAKTLRDPSLGKFNFP